MTSWLLGTVGIALLSVVRAPYGTRVKLFSSSGRRLLIPFLSTLPPSLLSSQEHFAELSLISASQAPLLGISASDRTEEEVMEEIRSQGFLLGKAC